MQYQIFHVYKGLLVKTVEQSLVNGGNIQVSLDSQVYIPSRSLSKQWSWGERCGYFLPGTTRHRTPTDQKTYLN